MMIPGIEDDEPPKPPAPPVPPGDGRPMVRVSLGFYHYLQECADLISAIATDNRRLGRGLALEWKIAARAIQISHGKSHE